MCQIALCDYFVALAVIKEKTQAKSILLLVYGKSVLPHIACEG
jgi:hypothetical protein